MKNIHELLTSSFQCSTAQSSIHQFITESSKVCEITMSKVKCVLKSLHMCLTLYSPKDCSAPGSSVHGIFQASILEWVAISSPGDLSDSGIEPRSPDLQVESEPLGHQ